MKYLLRMILGLLVMVIVLLIGVAWPSPRVAAQPPVPAPGNRPLDTATPTATPTFPSGGCVGGWHQIPVPNVGALGSVAATADTNVWTVNGNHALRWNGTSWTTYTLPSPNAYSYSVVGVATRGSNNTWVVGSYSRFGGSASNALVEHWDGTAWTVLCCGDPIAVGAPQGGGLPYANFSFAVLNASNGINAYGQYFIDYPPPNNYSYQTTCSAASCGGGYRGAADLFWNGFVSVGNGQTWGAGSLYDETHFTHHSQVNGSLITPDIGPLGGISGWAPNDVWTFAGGQILHWNGSAWSPAFTMPNSHYAFAILGLAADNAWAAGDSLFHWNGSTWSEAPHLPFVIHDMAAPSAASIWAVGDDGQYHSIVEHYVGTCPTTPTPTRTTTPAGTPTATSTPCTLGVFSDVHPADYFYAPVTYLATHYVIGGYGDCTFRPYNLTTRAQVVKIVVVGFALPVSTPAGDYTFADVPPDFPFYSWIETSADLHLVSGYNCGYPGEPCDPLNRPYFRPYNNVTRGQLSKIVVSAAGWPLLNPPSGSFADVLPGTAYYVFAETAASHDIISGYTCGGPGEPCDSQQRPYFRQYNSAIRGQIAKIAYLAITAPTPKPNLTPSVTPLPIMMASATPTATATPGTK